MGNKPQAPVGGPVENENIPPAAGLRRFRLELFDWTHHCINIDAKDEEDAKRIADECYEADGLEAFHCFNGGQEEYDVFPAKLRKPRPCRASGRRS